MENTKVSDTLCDAASAGEHMICHYSSEGSIISGMFICNFNSRSRGNTRTFDFPTAFANLIREASVSTPRLQLAPFGVQITPQISGEPF